MSKENEENCPLCHTEEKVQQADQEKQRAAYLKQQLEQKPEPGHGLPTGSCTTGHCR